MKVNIYKYAEARRLSTLREGVEMTVKAIKQLLKSPYFVVTTEEGVIVTKENIKKINQGESGDNYYMIWKSVDSDKLPTAIKVTKKLETTPSDMCSNDPNDDSLYEKLSSVELERGVKYIGEEAFMNCGELETIELPDTLVSIGSSGFNGCTSLKSIDIPKSVLAIGTSAFTGCSSLESVTLHEGLYTINTLAFADCVTLSSITIPSTVVSFGESSFKDCTSLAEVNLTVGLKTIGVETFSDCTALESISIPNTVTSIGENAFSGCSSLNSITFNGIFEASALTSTGVFSYGPSEVDVYLEDEAIETAAEENSWFSYGKTVRYHYPNDTKTVTYGS